MVRTPYFFFVYRDRVAEYRWRFYAPNNRILADSGEGYKNRSDCVAAIHLIKAKSPGASIEYHQSARARVDEESAGFCEPLHAGTRIVNPGG